MYGALILFEDEFIHIVGISFTALVLTELIMVALTVQTWHRFMVLAELLSLSIYVISLVIFKDYFGEIGCFIEIPSINCLLIKSLIFRFRIHPNFGFFLESSRHNTHQLFATLHTKSTSKKDIPTQLF